MMNTFRNIAVIFFLTFFIGCSTSDDDETKQEGSLVGTWEIRHAVEYDSEGEIWEEETFEPGAGESVLEVDEKFITAHEEGALFNGQAMAYTYDPKDQVLIYLGFRIDVDWLSNNEITMTVQDSEGKTITTWVRI